MAGIKDEIAPSSLAQAYGSLPIMDQIFDHAGGSKRIIVEEAKLSIEVFAYQETQARQIAYQEAFRELTQRLLLELQLLAAIFRYYQRLSYQFDPYSSVSPYGYSPYPYNPLPFNQSDSDDREPNFFQGIPHRYKRSQRADHQQSPHHISQAHIYSSGTNRQKPNFGLGSVIVAEAEHNVGQPVWAFTRFAPFCQAGNLGCAATVSELLQEAGVNIAGSASVGGLVSQLGNLGWHKIKISDKHQFHRGDVVFGLRGSRGHIGIISQVSNDQVLVCDNSSLSGTLKERTVESGNSFTPNGRFAGNLYVMRPQDS